MSTFVAGKVVKSRSWPLFSPLRPLDRTFGSLELGFPGPPVTPDIGPYDASKMASAYQWFQRLYGLRSAVQKRIVWGSIIVPMLLASGCEESSTRPEPIPGDTEQSRDTTPQPSPPAPDTSIKLTGELAQHFLLIQQGHPDAARIRLRRYLDAQPSDGQAHFLFGLTYHVEKRYDQALVSFEKARTLEPTYGQPAYFQAWAMYYLGQLDQARDSVQWYLQGSPDSADAHFLLGLLAYEQGQLDEAAMRFRSSERLFREAEQPRNDDIGKSLVRLADVQMQQGDFEGAQRSLTDAVALIPASPEVHYKLAQVFHRRGLPDRAAQAQNTYEELWHSRHPNTSFPE